MTATDSARCFGTGDPLMEQYHDEEWGKPLRGDAEFFERIALEGFQSGLSWATVLHKRDAFGRAFHGFDPQVVAGFGEDDVERLLQDAGIVRNRRKIEAAIANARAIVDLQQRGGSLTDLIWSHAPADPRPQPIITWDQIATQSPESVALAKALKAEGLVFVGPVTMYAMMQACGLVNDHLEHCPAR